MTDIKKNLDAIRNRIEKAANRAGRDPESVVLVAVSKVHPASVIREAHASGQRHFGENYAQELRDKASELADLDGLHWHFIGHLQRNKVKYVAPSVAVLETVDSTRLIAELSKGAKKFDRIIECLVQVNVGDEDQKSGCTPEETGELLKAVETAPGLRLKGLMTIPPWDLEAEETRKYFRALAGLRENHGGPGRLPHLSMGMSQDFEVAIEEGATLVRVGTAIFGAR
jgi:PLP dependent protein